MVFIVFRFGFPYSSWRICWHNESPCIILCLILYIFSSTSAFQLLSGLFPCIWLTDFFSLKQRFHNLLCTSWLIFFPLLKKQVSALWSFSTICLIMQLISYREDSLSSSFDRCINTMVTNLCKSCHFQRAERRCCNNILVQSQYEHIDADTPLSYSCVHILE